MAVYTSIDNPELYFQAKIYTGDASTQAVTLDGDEDMQPNFVWIKNRATTGYNTLFDSVRGVEKPLWSNAASSEGSDSNTLTAFGSDGFTVASDAAVNGSGNSLVAYCWKESADAGFDIVTFTGSGGTQNISHSLSAKPELILNKSRSASGNWYVYHGANTSAPETDFLQLQATDATSDNATLWNDTAPTTSVFTVGSAFDNTTTYVAYAFASKQGYSKFGKYVGNANTNGTFIYTGFSPAWILHKRSSNTGDWRVWNNKSEGFNPNPHALFPNTDATEYNTSNLHIDFLSNGFKFRTSDSNVNTSGETYIYMAFAEAPFVNSNGVPCNAR